MKEERGLTKLKYHCKECGYNFKVAAPIGRGEPYLSKIFCPICGSDKVAHGWRHQKKEKEKVKQTVLE